MVRSVDTRTEARLDPKKSKSPPPRKTRRIMREGPSAAAKKASTIKKPDRIKYIPISLHTETLGKWTMNSSAGSLSCTQSGSLHEYTSANVQIGRPQERPSTKLFSRIIDGRQQS